MMSLSLKAITGHAQVVFNHLVSNNLLNIQSIYFSIGGEFQKIQLIAIGYT